MYQGCKKYIPFVPVSLPNRTWYCLAVPFLPIPGFP